MHVPSKIPVHEKNLCSLKWSSKIPSLINFLYSKKGKTKDIGGTVKELTKLKSQSIDKSKSVNRIKDSKTTVNKYTTILTLFYFLLWHKNSSVIAS